MCIVWYTRTLSHGINLRQRVSEGQISRLLIIFFHISHHEGVFIQPDNLVYIYVIVYFILSFHGGCVELNAGMS